MAHRRSLDRSGSYLNGIAGVLIHGRNDLGGPPITAWQLAQRWTSAEVHVVSAAGHLGNEHMDELVLSSLKRFSRSNTRCS
jgi:proline iminopeptidase